MHAEAVVSVAAVRVLATLWLLDSDCNDAGEECACRTNPTEIRLRVHTIRLPRGMCMYYGELAMVEVRDTGYLGFHV